jgi:lipoprotein-anchoring transpeptidase ErfK/SrfK
VGVAEAFRAGTIVVQKHERLLYYVTGVGQAVRYPIGVGRIATQWNGATYLTAKYTDPSWTPSANIRRDKPRLPSFIPDGFPENPMGVVAMTLSGGVLAVHGTNEPSTIGHFVPYGCISMFNEDAEDLYRRVGIGTPVIVE